MKVWAYRVFDDLGELVFESDYMYLSKAEARRAAKREGLSGTIQFDSLEMNF